MLAAVAAADPADAIAAGLDALARAGVRASVEPAADAGPAVPLRRGGRVLGSLVLADAADTAVAEAVAPAFALALGAASAQPESSALIEAGIAAGAAASFDEAISVVLESCLKLARADGATLVVWSDARDCGVVRAGVGAGAPFVGELVRLGENVASQAVASARPVVIYGETGDGMVGALAEGVRALACSCAVPLELGGAPLATLQAGWIEPPSEGDVERAIALLQTLSTVTGLAARAHDERSQERDVALLEAVLDSVGEGIWVHTADRRLVNAAARRILGLAPGDPVPDDPAGIAVRELDGSPVTEQPSARAVQTGEAQPFRNRFVAADGRERVVDGTAAPVLADVAGAIGVVVSFRDVTEEHATADLKDRLLTRLFETLPTAIAVFDPKTFEARSANRAFLDLVGRDAADVVGRTPPYPWWPEGHELDVASEDKERFEWLYRRGDGTLVPVDLTRTVVRSEQGEPLAIVVLVQDLSERHRFEQQLVQTGKLAAIGELAAGVAHEINNPLFAILGLVEFLLKDVEAGSKIAARLELIQQTGLEIKEIVRALLDFARERTDELSLVDLNDVASQTVDLVRRATSAKGIEIVEAYADAPVVVEASATQLKQVILNLLTNAQHAQPDGGSITIEVARDGGWATARIRDTGPGIPPDALGRIFDPFFTTKRDVGGTGLGLSVSLGIAQMHGGTLEVDSRVGDGATFTLRIPLAPVQEAAA